MDYIKTFFANKRTGYYLTVTASFLALIQLIIYCVAFQDPKIAGYFTSLTVVFSVIAVLAGFVLSSFKITSRFAPGVLTACEFISLLAMNYYGYWYYSEVFYSGFSLSTLGDMHYGYLASIILFVLILIIGCVSIFMGQYKDNEVKEEK